MYPFVCLAGYAALCVCVELLLSLCAQGERVASHAISTFSTTCRSSSALLLLALFRPTFSLSLSLPSRRPRGRSPDAAPRIRFIKRPAQSASRAHNKQPPRRSGPLRCAGPERDQVELDRATPPIRASLVQFSVNENTSGREPERFGSEIADGGGGETFELFRIDNDTKRSIKRTMAASRTGKCVPLVCVAAQTRCERRKPSDRRPVCGSNRRLFSRCSTTRRIDSHFRSRNCSLCAQRIQAKWFSSDAALDRIAMQCDRIGRIGEMRPTCKLRRRGQLESGNYSARIVAARGDHSFWLEVGLVA